MPEENRSYDPYPIQTITVPRTASDIQETIMNWDKLGFRLVSMVTDHAIERHVIMVFERRTPDSAGIVAILKGVNRILKVFESFVAEWREGRHPSRPDRE